MSGNHHTIFVDTCPVCNGDGGFESMPTGYDHVNGNPTTHWIRCHACDGNGEVETEYECRTLEDLEQEDAARKIAEEMEREERAAHGQFGVGA